MRIYEKQYSLQKLNGEVGRVNVFDPEQKGFKKALVTIVFCGVCLDATLHLYIGKYLGPDKCEKHDRKTYEEKLSLLGCADVSLLDSCKHFRLCRKEIVHEKAYLDKNIRSAQNEAEKSMLLLNNVFDFLKNKKN